MKKIFLMTLCISFFTLPIFSQKKDSFNVFLNYFPEVNLPITSKDFKHDYSAKDLDTTFVAEFIDDSKIKYYTVYQDSETGVVTFDGFLYYNYEALGKISFNKNIWWTIHQFSGEVEYEYRYLSSYDNYGNKFDTLLIEFDILDSVYSRFIIEKNKNIKIFFYESYNDKHNQSKIIVKTYKMNKHNKFFIYQADSLITNHNFYDYFHEKIDGDPFYIKEK